MSKAVQVMDLDCRVPRREVERYLGYPRPGCCPTRTADRLDQLWPVAQELVRPRGSYLLVEPERASWLGLPAMRRPFGLGLVSIGPRLEEQVAMLGAEGRLVEALLLDGFGSAAAEAAANTLESRMLLEADLGDGSGCSRISPGYGSWALEAQQRVLALLPAREMGVHLTVGLMMIPRKSVSFALSPCFPGAGSPCRDCPCEGCDYRSEEER